MRMWMIDPSLLCKNHLLGEHAEIHKHKPSFENHHSITGRVYPVVLIEPSEMEVRHNQLAEEMTKRGYNHKSPYSLPDLSYLSDSERFAKVDIEYNINDLSSRCPECAKRINERKAEHGK